MTNFEYYSTYGRAEEEFNKQTIGYDRPITKDDALKFIDWLYEKHTEKKETGYTLIYLVHRGDKNKPERYSTYIPDGDIEDAETYLDSKIRPSHYPFMVQLLCQLRGKHLDYDYDPVEINSAGENHSGCNSGCSSDSGYSFSFETMLKKMYHQQKITNEILSRIESRIR